MRIVGEYRRPCRAWPCKRRSGVAFRGCPPPDLCQSNATQRGRYCCEGVTLIRQTPKNCDCYGSNVRVTQLTQVSWWLSRCLSRWMRQDAFPQLWSVRQRRQQRPTSCKETLCRLANQLVHKTVLRAMYECSQIFCLHSRHICFSVLTLWKRPLFGLCTSKKYEDLFCFCRLKGSQYKWCNKSLTGMIITC